MSSEAPSGTAVPTRRPMRADAKRNYDRLLDTARTAFLERGTDVPLEDIAREAKVGIGTLYRHFPTRQDLMEAVFLDKVDTLSELSGTLRNTADPGAALETWLRALIEFSNDFRGLSRSLLLTEDGKVTKKSCHSILIDVAEDLVERARQAGAIRSDVSSSIVLKLANGIAVAIEHLDAADSERVIQVMMDGMRHDQR
ncbi:MAG TPA: helix-turn-helix domain-containing protein [Mycobacteriales bacterium]|nr:helix-turn-helix domain-containing protein [Mycobacteriales bacterium]